MSWLICPFFFSLGTFSQFGGQQYTREVYNFPMEYTTKTSISHSSLDPHFSGRDQRKI